MEQINIATGNQLHMLPLTRKECCCLYLKYVSIVKPKMTGNEIELPYSILTITANLFSVLVGDIVA